MTPRRCYVCGHKASWRCLCPQVRGGAQQHRLACGVHLNRIAADLHAAAQTYWPGARDLAVAINPVYA